MNFKLVTVIIATTCAAYCQAQFYPNFFNQGNNNNVPGLFPVLNNQNERPASSWPFPSNPQQQQQIQQNLNDQVGLGQNPKSPQESSFQQPFQSQNSQYPNDSGRQNYFNNNPFFNLFPNWFGNNNNNSPPKLQSFQNPNRPGYQQQQQPLQQQQVPLQQSEPSSGFTPNQQQTNPVSGYNNGQQQTNPASGYNNGQQQSIPQQPNYQSPNQQSIPQQPNYQSPNQQPNYQFPNQQTNYQTPNQPQTYPGNTFQNQQYIPQQSGFNGRPREQPESQFDDGQYRPDKYGGAPSQYNGASSPNSNYNGNDDFQQGNNQYNHQQERDLVGDLRINGSSDQTNIGQSPTNLSGIGDASQSPNWVYPDD